MKTAARPLELRLTSEIDVDKLEKYESQSRVALVNQFRAAAERDRAKLFSVFAPLIVLATLVTIFFVSM